ncbi:MAG: FGGY family carbohydrate kinase [Planctomycetota bacterium]
MKIILSLDIGTTKISALALSVETLQPLAVISAPNSAAVPGLPPERHEQNPLRIRDDCLNLLSALPGNDAVHTDAVVGIAISGQMHGVLLADSSLMCLTNLITWRDRRTVGFDGPDNAEETGSRLCAGYGGVTLNWLVKNGALPRDAVALTIADYIAASLTGKIATEPTHAASWGIFSLRNNRWDAALIEHLGIPRTALPEIRPSSRPLEKLSAETAGALGLSPEVMVCSPLGDNQAAFVGAAGFSGDAAVVNIGTGAQVSIPQKKFTYVKPFETRPMPFGGFILVGASLCGGWAYEYLKDFFGATVRGIAGIELDDNAIYERMNALAEKAGEMTGLLADTRFSGTRSDPRVRGSISNIDTGNLAPGNLARAFTTGIVRELADIMSDAGIANREHVIACGNAVRKNPLITRVIGRIFGVPCFVGQIQEEAALGAAYAAAVGMELVSADEIRPRLEAAQ